MTSEMTDLSVGLAKYPETLAVVSAVLAVWPEHEAYLGKNFRRRSPEMMDSTELASAAARRLIDGQETTFAQDYRWTCDKLRDEELYFHREGRYRLTSFAEAVAEVYSDNDYMGHYVNGLLLSQILWYNHIATFDMFTRNVVGGLRAPVNYLEIGPGHGLMMYCAAQSPMVRSLEAWDVSEVSIRETQRALRRLGVQKPTNFRQVDILRADPPADKFDLIVVSEVLEHLEEPDRALRFLRLALKEGGRIFINVPLNSPSPDHIHLFETPADVQTLVETAGRWQTRSVCPQV